MIRRVMVVGSAGAGKSTVSRRVAERHGLPVVPLDHHYWRPGWRPAPADEWHDTLADLVAADRWVHDGNYASSLPSRLPRADLVVFLDLPRLLCLWRVVVRRWRGGTGIPGCPDRLRRQFLRYVWDYPRRHRPIVLARLAEQGEPPMVLRLRSRREVRDFLATLD